MARPATTSGAVSSTNCLRRRSSGSHPSASPLRRLLLIQEQAAHILPVPGSHSVSNLPVPPRKGAPAHGLAAGIAVFHTKFGEGKVLALEGSGTHERAQVHFARHSV